MNVQFSAVIAWLAPKAAMDKKQRRGGSLPRNSGIPETDKPQNGNGNRGGYRYRPSNGLMLMQSDDSGPPLGP